MICTPVSHLLISLHFYCRENFRTDYQDLGALRAIIHDAKVLVLTATAATATIKKVRDVLLIPDCEVVSLCPNRHNIYLGKIFRLADNVPNQKSKRDILEPLAKELNTLRDKFPLTIVYAKLACISDAYRWFSSLVKNSLSPSGKLSCFVNVILSKFIYMHVEVCLALFAILNAILKCHFSLPSHILSFGSVYGGSKIVPEIC